VVDVVVTAEKNLVPTKNGAGTAMVDPVDGITAVRSATDGALVWAVTNGVTTVGTATAGIMVTMVINGIMAIGTGTKADNGAAEILRKKTMEDRIITVMVTVIMEAEVRKDHHAHNPNHNLNHNHSRNRNHNRLNRVNASVWQTLQSNWFK